MFPGPSPLVFESLIWNKPTWFDAFTTHGFPCDSQYMIRNIVDVDQSPYAATAGPQHSSDRARDLYPHIPQSSAASAAICGFGATTGRVAPRDARCARIRAAASILAAVV